MAKSAPSHRADIGKSTADILRGLIMRRELSPGQQIRQEELSEQIGVSRSPIREALRALESEGLVRHSRNQGYFVARLTKSELGQVYLMRRLLETEIFTSINLPTKGELAKLEAANNSVRKAAEEAALGAMLAANREFHFLLFGLSPLDLVVRQVQNLWHLSEAYRATYLWLPETRQRVVDEHDQMIEALADKDIGLLVEISNRHRSASEGTVIQMING